MQADNGNVGVGIGTTPPGFKLDVGDRIRLKARTSWQCGNLALPLSPKRGRRIPFGIRTGQPNRTSMVPTVALKAVVSDGD